MDAKDRLRISRERIGLTTKYVSKALGIPETDLANIENGNRGISDEEMAIFRDLYGVTDEYLMRNNREKMQELFPKWTGKLTEEDMEETISLVEFQKSLSERKRNQNLLSN